jgi:hypothetical protein
LVNCFFSGAPIGWPRRSIEQEPGNTSRLARWSYRNSPARIIQAGRIVGLCGITKRIGCMMCGALRISSSRSASDLRTMPNS